MRFYLYKMTTDDGGAPCVRDATLSLAICKPMIRSAAPEGGMLLGFAANELSDDNRLIYAAKITKRVSGKEYYSDGRYADRADCIYRATREGFSRRHGAKFHPSADDLTHDLGTPPDFRRAWVLLSEGFENFRYFATTRPEYYKRANPQLRREIESLTQGHRVNHEPALRRELEGLCSDLFSAPFMSSDTRIPDVSSRTRCHDCSTDDDFTEC